MRIAIAGAGVTGSYLAHMLMVNGHNVDVYESSKESNHFAVCAWGAPFSDLTRFSKNAGLNFNDYILYLGKTGVFEEPDGRSQKYNVNGLVTYDKYRWEQDLLRGTNVKYNCRLTSKSLLVSQYDLVVDCTGFHRTLLPKPQEDFILPAYEYLVENVKGMDYFYFRNYKNSKGYLWYFPLGDGKGYLGAGDLDRNYDGLGTFLQQNPQATIVKKIGRPIRLSPPQRMYPFHNNNIVGVGESIGCVFPITGEGIAPSLKCCEIFLQILDANRYQFDFKQYERKVLEEFSYFENAFKILKVMMKKELQYITNQIPDLKQLVVNNPIYSTVINKAANIMELISFLFYLSDEIRYPITDFKDLVNLLDDNITSKSLYNTLLENVPTSSLPICNKQDLNEVLILLKKGFVNMLLFGKLMAVAMI